MRKTLSIALAVIADAVRRKVVLVVVVFSALLAFIAPSLPSYGAGVAEAVFREVAISLMFAAALVVTVALAATRVPSETERRTVFGILSRDVRRWQYIVGTWAGVFVVVGATLLVSALVTILTGYAVYQVPMWRLLAAALAVWLEMGVVGALTVLLSTRVGAVTSAVGALVFVFVGHSVGVLTGPITRGGKPPWYVPSLEVFDVMNPVAHGTGYSLAYGAAMLVAFVGWVGVLLLMSTALFERRDL